jgi:hypothetical protein
MFLPVTGNNDECFAAWFKMTDAYEHREYLAIW